ncbi:ABC transporter substrate-binding protein [Euzebya tangerina]|uniref:ABC transporter substrate-binding protein n=1 Tax=Euzebya tangerina TaxID=591198 RepID=UPI0013C32DFD|nr:ABC transporter substrate-binding protein [Euzebya tangerina]
MTRLVALLMVLALLLTACDGGDEPEPPEQAASDASADGSADEEAALPDSAAGIRLGYRPQWPTPIQIGQDDGFFAQAVGVDVEWVALDSGPEMGEALAAGEVDIAYSLDLASFAEAVQNGPASRVVGIAVSYSEAVETSGGGTYDIVAVPETVADERPQVVAAFLRVTQDFNRMWADSSEELNPIIAQAAGMEGVGDFLAGEQWFSFPTLEEQLSEEWMGGRVVEELAAQMDTLAETGEGPAAPSDVSELVTTSFLETALDG